MRLIPQLGSRTTSSQTRRGRPTAKLKLQALEDCWVPSFGLGTALGFGGASDDYGRGIALDAAGSMYVSGHFNGTTDFDSNGTNPTSNHVLTATDTSGYGDGFVAKYLANGTFQWAADLGPGFAGHIAVNGSDVFVPYSSGSANPFTANVTELDAATGVALWTTSLGVGHAQSAVIGPAGSLYVGGGWSGTSTVPAGLVARLDPTSGNVLWSRTSNDGWAGAFQLAVDGAGNAYLTGNFGGTTTFGSTSLTSYSTTEDVFVWKLNANGTSVWAGEMGGYFGYNAGFGITSDGSGNAYVTGRWTSGSNNFNPGSGKAVSLPSHGGLDIFIVKLVPGSNGAMKLGWAKDIGGSGTDWGEQVTVDGSGNVYTTGTFTGPANFNPNNGQQHVLQGYGGKDIFVSEMDSNGNYVAAVGLGGTMDDIGHDIVLDASRNVYTTGFFSGTADFDPTSGTYNLTSNGSIDVFVSKLTQSGAGPMGSPPNLGGKDGDSGDILFGALPSSDTDSPIASTESPMARRALPLFLDLSVADLTPILVGTKRLDSVDVRGLPRSPANFVGLLSDGNTVVVDLS